MFYTDTDITDLHVLLELI